MVSISIAKNVYKPKRTKHVVFCFFQRLTTYCYQHLLIYLVTNFLLFEEAATDHF